MSSIPLPKPDKQVLRRRHRILRELKEIVPDAVFVENIAGLRAFETDALTAYRQVPLMVVLPTNTQEVALVLAYCHTHNIKIIPRGAGTSLCGGALPAQDAIVLSVARMNALLDVNFENRTVRVQSGITNLGVSNLTSSRGFFYAPDPSSQMACTIAGNIAMNSGGAHCLKYGVTSNNLLGGSGA